MAEIFLETFDLTVGYRGNPLIKDINISVSLGEIVTMIGPNGAGKSTILKSITKHLQTISGDVKVADASLSEISYKKLAQRLSVVLTEKIKGELLTCYDVVSTGRYPYTNTLGTLSDRDREIISESMEKANVTSLADRDFSAISDGQRQRVLLARAICQEPQIIVLDEPTSFLDIKHKLELLNILHTMAKEDNIAVIMSLHEIDLAQKISDKVICVKGEVIRNYGTPDEIFREEIINELYGINDGSYNIAFGSVELPRPKGEAEIFVIGGNGTGIPIYRKLTKEGIPFSTGILEENDVDYYVAKNLAEKVFSIPAFGSATESLCKSAEEEMRRCNQIIDGGVEIRDSNRYINKLREMADDIK